MEGSNSEGKGRGAKMGIYGGKAKTKGHLRSHVEAILKKS